MATGTELYLGVTGPEDIQKAAAELGLVVDIDNREIGPDRILMEVMKPQLVAAHRAALIEIGLTDFINPAVLTYADGRPIYVMEGHVYVRTPTGVRNIVPWGLELSYDPDEMGEEPEHALLGVSLVSRYSPTFLDWRQEHGGSGDPIKLAGETLANIEVARKHLAPILPFIKDAPICIKENHY